MIFLPGLVLAAKPAKGGDEYVEADVSDCFLQGQQYKSGMQKHSSSQRKPLCMCIGAVLLFLLCEEKVDYFFKKA